MNKSEFLNLMKFPAEWLEWDMYPDELFEEQVRMYQKGDEQEAEHDRNGAFHWWLKKNIAADQLRKLVLLAFKDPEPLVGEDVRRYIASRNDLPPEVRELVGGNRRPEAKSEFLKLMRFPTEWLEWDMYPEALFEKQLHLYRPGDERGAEHDRNGAFHWWLEQEITADQLKKLVLLTFKDPDPMMGEDVREHIKRRNELPQDVRDLLVESRCRT